jgi:putative membrane protein
MYYFNDLFFPNFFFGPLLMIGFWALVIWGIVSFMNSFSQTPTKGSHDSAKNILKERYAKGEITKEQFESMKKDIQ